MEKRKITALDFRDCAEEAVPANSAQKLGYVRSFFSENMNFSDCEISGIEMVSGVFQKCDFSGCVIHDSILSGVEFVNCNISGLVLYSECTQVSFATMLEVTTYERFLEEER